MIYETKLQNILYASEILNIVLLTPYFDYLVFSTCQHKYKWILCIKKAGVKMFVLKISDIQNI